MHHSQICFTSRKKFVDIALQTVAESELTTEFGNKSQLCAIRLNASRLFPNISSVERTAHHGKLEKCIEQ